jgi:iron(III) transport system substrate-binding protein
MKDKFFRLAVLILMLGFWANSSEVLAANVGLQKAKQDSEAKGFMFETSHDEIVAKARKEAKLNTTYAVEPETNKAIVSAFKKRYPFIDVYSEELSGAEMNQRFLLGLTAGKAADYDIQCPAAQFYPEYIRYIKKVDVLGMAQEKVLAIPPPMIEPKNRVTVSIASSIHAVGYNRNLVPEDKVPNSWEDFLKPEFKGKKFMVDIVPMGFTSLIPGLGEKWVVDYARKIAAQDPLWVRGQERQLTYIINGEVPLFLLTYHYVCVYMTKKDPAGCLGCKVIEPVPARIQNFNVLSNAARNPYCGLLWLEFLVSPEAQKIIDDYEAFNASIYSPDTKLAKLVQGKKLSINNWDTWDNSARWDRMVFEAFGFPQAIKK